MLPGSTPAATSTATHVLVDVNVMLWIIGLIVFLILSSVAVVAVINAVVLRNYQTSGFHVILIQRVKKRHQSCLYILHVTISELYC